MGSFSEDYRNRICVIGLPDERALVDVNKLEDDYSSDFVLLAEAGVGYPVTKIAWEPASLLKEQWKGAGVELLTTTSDALRIWEYAVDGAGGDPKQNAYVGRHVSQPTPRLSQRVALSSVRRILLLS
jgi:WD repeat-containing protein 68